MLVQENRNNWAQNITFIEATTKCTVIQIRAEGPLVNDDHSTH